MQFGALGAAWVNRTQIWVNRTQIWVKSTQIWVRFTHAAPNAQNPRRSQIPQSVPCGCVGVCACVLTHFRRRMCRQRLRNVFAPVCVDSVCACMSPCKHSSGIFTADFEFPVHATAMNCGVHVLLRHTFLVQQLPCTVLPPSFGVLRTFLLMLLILSSVLMA